MGFKDVLVTNFSSAAGDLVNTSIEALLEDGSILEKVPVLNLVIGGKKTINSIQEAYLIKKIIRFMIEADTISLEERVSFLRESLGEDQQSFTEKLLHTLSRLDDVNKSEYIAKLYRAVIYKKITLEEFYRLIRIIDQVYVEDINTLLKNSKYKGLFAYSLSFAGVTERENTWGDIAGKTKEEDMEYKLTSIGSLLKECLSI